MLTAMTYRRSLAAVLVSVMLAACGGSTHSTSAGTTATTASSQAAATTPPTTTSTATAATTATTATATTTRATRPPEVPAGRGQKKARPTPSVSSGVTIPAAFLISPGAKLSPPSVAVPPGVSISLRVENRDHASHTVVLAAGRRPRLRLRAGAGGLTIVTGLPIGSYQVLLDGTAQANVVVGAQGGP